MIIKKILAVLFLIVFLSLAGLVYIFYEIKTATVEISAQSIDIKKGENLDSIITKLEQAKLITNPLLFKLYLTYSGLDQKIGFGVYFFDGHYTLPEVAHRLTDFSKAETAITIVEGWNNKEIASYLENEGLAEADKFLKAVSQKISRFSADYEFLLDKPDSIDLEGYLFPDTYRVFRQNPDVDAMIIKMLNNFDSKLTEKMRQDIRAQGKSIFEIITMASIIEKEVRQPIDMKNVADIFYKRLKVGMPLQSDATINYITASGRAQSTSADLAIDNLYNTYKYPGLPPGPISNPGLEAIKAAIYPAKNQYYYFLTTLDTGEVIYSVTYEEHLANKRKYLD